MGKMFGELWDVVSAFVDQPLVAGQEIGHQNPPLEVVSNQPHSGLRPEFDASTLDLGRLEVDQRLVVPPNTHLRDIVTSVDIAYSVVPSGGTVLPQTGAQGGHSVHEASLNWEAGASSRPWQTQSSFNADSYDCLTRLLESLPEPGDEASFLPTALEAVLPEPEIPDDLRLVELKNCLRIFQIGKNTDEDLLTFDRQCVKAVLIEKEVEAALILDGLDPRLISLHRHEIRNVLFIYRDDFVSEPTLSSYINQIQTVGTRNCTPYHRILRAIRNYDIIF